MIYTIFSSGNNLSFGGHNIFLIILTSLVSVFIKKMFDFI